ncbi:hypothetical protein PTSG_11526 [Salpingoeca rosetta]|uniref:MRPL25 domain-containing protein n=1 Tax=Salpingoeca rosetta (strain ATCC 50818 / BSB-021) TaxID=946362 RepID=F2TV95_SALR5|nr:uncharacterized protein PTSG_11526 [Salpingoeca rosetta]EGD71991.1 hypothetical protein PTSG_11526 [Salpingoeca rosetta]|eukprot:XP_004998563.1 hypothetical protein PTSG_11526 [Salpingoeca rosetta]
MSLAKTAAQAAKRVIAASKPTKINGRWRQPELSGRSLAKARKEWEATFTEPWPLQKERGQPNQKPKGHKHERLKAER